MYRHISAHKSGAIKGKEWCEKCHRKEEMGRPVIGKPKDIRIALRMDEDTLKKLDDVCKEKKISRSELVRQLINEMK